MLEEAPIYQEVFDCILSEEKVNQYNADQGSMINLIIKMSKELEGSSDYVLKALSLLIKCLEFFSDSEKPYFQESEDKQNLTLFTQSFLDFHPAVVVEKDMSEYKPEIKETIATVTARIFASHVKLAWVESQESSQDTKVLCNKYSICCNHCKNIFLQGFSCFELLKSIVD
jgi:hypothetical protein